ncbi:MAG: methionyl-tRNA formyltransferase [Syntrophomonadaceae bacterium]
MKVVFMGTSDFAVPSLARLVEYNYSIAGVVTQPDRPRGRGKKISFSPVKELSIKLGLEIFQPNRIGDSESTDVLRYWEPDVIVVVAYGQILPAEVLDLPRLGCINVHGSLLPHYRGAAPIQRAIMAGDKVTGVTTMFMNTGLDTGDIILQTPMEIGLEMDFGEVHDLLARAGADLLLDTMAVLASGSNPRRKQDEHRISYAPRLSREEERIDWHQDAITIKNHIRALSPQPGAYTSLRGQRFKIFRSQVLEPDIGSKAGEIVDITSEGFAVQTGNGVLEILEVQKEGKKRISSLDFMKGFGLEPGEILS